MNTTIIKPFTVMDEFNLIRTATDYSLERDESGWVSGNFYHCKLTSAFQPVLDSSGEKIIGHAAYIRSESEGEIALWPGQVFSMASGDKQLIELDRLCRAIHTLNYFRQSPDHTGRLFLHVHSRLLESIRSGHGRTFKDFLDLIGVNTSRIVIEIPSVLNHDGTLLQKLISSYRSYGYQVAVNFNSRLGHWVLGTDDLYPDVIIIQAHDLPRYQANRHANNPIRDSRSLLHVRKIETQEQLTAARQAGADYMQGNFPGKMTRAVVWHRRPALVRQNFHS